MRVSCLAEREEKDEDDNEDEDDRKDEEVDDRRGKDSARMI